MQRLSWREFADRYAVRYQVHGPYRCALASLRVKILCEYVNTPP